MLRAGYLTLASIVEHVSQLRVDFRVYTTHEFSLEVTRGVADRFFEFNETTTLITLNRCFYVIFLHSTILSPVCRILVFFMEER